MKSKKGTPATSPKKQPGPQQAESLTLTDVRQVKVLADPLRIRILEELCAEERTTKQVAERLGEKPTKLYHHVEALERVGLIRLTRTRQNRGTIEKYYISVARQVKADSRIFAAADAGSGPESDTLRAMIRTVFDRTGEEMLGLLAQNRGQEGIEEQGVLSYLEVRFDTKQQGRQFQTKLMKLIRSLEEPGKKARGPAGHRYRLTVAFYPLDLETPQGTLKSTRKRSK